jgi:hypothetical protein
MPALPASKTINEEIIERKRRELDARRAAHEEAVGPHLALIERLKALVPAGNPDLRAIAELYFLVEMIEPEMVRAAKAFAELRIDRRAEIPARRKSIVAA